MATKGTNLPGSFEDETTVPHKRYNGKIHGNLFYQNPRVSVSIWDAVRRCWFDIPTPDVRLNIGKGILKLESIRPHKKENGQPRPSGGLSLASLEFPIKKKKKMNWSLEWIEPKTHHSQDNNSTAHYKPVFYFQVSKPGKLGKIEDSILPYDAIDQTEEVFSFFVSVQNYLKNGLYTSPNQHISEYMRNPWLCLVAGRKPQSDIERICEVFSSSETRYNFVNVDELPPDEDGFELEPSISDELETQSDSVAMQISSSQDQSYGDTSTTVQGSDNIVTENEADLIKDDIDPFSESSGFSEAARISNVSELDCRDGKNQSGQVATEYRVSSPGSAADKQADISKTDLLTEAKSIQSQLCYIDREIELLQKRARLVQRLMEIEAQLGPSSLQ